MNNYLLVKSLGDCFCRFLVLFFFINAFICNQAEAQEPKLMLPIGHSLILYAEFSPDGNKVVTASAEGKGAIWDGHNGKLLAELNGHAKYICSAIFSPDGKKILTASEDFTAKIWDAQTGKLLTNLIGHENKVNRAFFSTEGNRIITASLDSTAIIWDVQTGKVLRKLIGHSGIVTTASFSPDGKSVVTASDDKTSKIWDSKSGQLLITLKGHSKLISSVKFSYIGNRIATSSHDSTVKIWDSKLGTLLFTLTGHRNKINSVVFSPDNKCLVTASDDSTAKIWDIQTGAQIADLKGHTGKVSGASFSFDSHNIVTGSWDKTAKIWNATSGLLQQTLIEKNNIPGPPITSASFSPKGDKVITSSFDSFVTIWECQKGTKLLDLKSFTSLVQTVNFSPDGKMVLSSTGAASKLWDIQTGVLIATFKTKAGYNGFSSFSPDGNKILTISFDGKAELWDAKKFILLKILNPNTSEIISAKFSNDSKKIISGAENGSAKIWDAETGSLLLDFNKHPGEYVSIDISPDDNKVVTINDSTGKVWDAKSGKFLFGFDKPLKDVVSVNYSPDNKKIITSSMDNNAYVWDAKTGKLLMILKGHVDELNSAIFSKNSKLIVTSSVDKSAKIWNANNGKLIADLKGHTQIIRDASFSNNNLKVLTCAMDNTAKIWDVKTGNLLNDLAGHSLFIPSANFSPNNKNVITGSWDNTTKLWDAESGELLYTFIAIDSTDYLVVDKYNRYDGSPGARKLLYFTCGTEVIGLEQVKDQLWVPGLAERIMKGETINAPKLSELNLCGLTPLVEKVESKKNNYQFLISPRKGGLGESVLLVNDIEVKRYKQEQLKKKGSNYMLTVKEKEVQPFFVTGKSNSVTVKAFTAKNDIASRGAEVINEAVNTTTVAPNLYAVMVGVSDYKGEELDLKYAAKDAVDIASALGASARKLLNTDGKEHVFLYNLTTTSDRYQLPEKNSIKNVLKEIGAKATVNDILLVFFAGHGVTQGDKKQFYFLTADASRASSTDAPEAVGISTSELTEWMKPELIKAHKRILILDACNSGQAINELVKIGEQNQNYIAARNDDQAQQIKAIEKLNERSGMFILAASASNQSAYEMGRYAQGLLTYALLKAMKEQPDILEDNKYLNVSRWFGAAEKTVTDIVRETGNRQQPQVVSAGNFNIGVIDQEVIKNIKLPQQKAVFTASNFQNNDVSILEDDLELGKLVNQTMYAISARGSDNSLNYLPVSNSPDAYSLIGRYEVIGKTVKVVVAIRQNKIPKHRFEVSGTSADLKTLAADIIKQVEDWCAKNSIK